MGTLQRYSVNLLWLSIIYYADTKGPILTQGLNITIREPRKKMLLKVRSELGYTVFIFSS